MANFAFYSIIFIVNRLINKTNSKLLKLTEHTLGTQALILHRSGVTPVSSEKRVGNALLQWASWVKKGIEQKKIPKPPGRIKTEPENQLRLFQG